MKRAKDCGASFAFHSLVRLAGSVRDVFEQKIKDKLPPERVERIMKRLRESRGGFVSDTRFGNRMRGQGVYWKSISDMFRLARKKFDLDNFPPAIEPSPFRRPSPQLELFS
jgi:DNA repair photolyase